MKRFSTMAFQWQQHMTVKEANTNNIGSPHCPRCCKPAVPPTRHCIKERRSALATVRSNRRREDHVVFVVLHQATTMDQASPPP
ncbi:hypothetical protein SESBI_23969 [Sesbania bispinosa]|nr:hypothetical protein SESBI_23969 [Sesbania bispinosa]